jgi:putative transposase
MAYQFIKVNRNRYTVREMAGLLGVSCSAYYRWTRVGISTRRQEADAELVRLIREIQEKHLRRYGSPRVREELWKKYGKRVSLKKVACLMRENNLNSRRKGKFIPTTDSRHTLPVYENILNREFHAEKPGQ